MSLKMIQDSSHITNGERKVLGYTKLTKIVVDCTKFRR